MLSEQLTAWAAVAAVVISLVNVGLSARLVRRQESTQWIRGHLPELIAGFNDATHRFMVKVHRGDWDGVAPEARSSHGMDEAREALAYLSKLQVFAGPATILAAHKTFDAVDAIRMHHLSVLEAGGRVDQDWSRYWSYAQANHAFMTASRREMGLKPPPALRPEVLPSHQASRWTAIRSWFRRHTPADS
ncbi:MULTISPECIES: hypothetical protein [Streptomyces]|uniref:hypothetical protein n=1 Tax=Streptomyces lycopersici TaxID=2974589 RepID=UPI0021D2EA1D|nr:hypothetical protein [Streptomyces sp. NEAU-383]